MDADGDPARPGGQCLGLGRLRPWDLDRHAAQGGECQAPAYPVSASPWLDRADVLLFLRSIRHELGDNDRIPCHGGPAPVARRRGASGARRRTARPRGQASITPLIDIHEGPDGLILEADLPGATEEGVTIQLEDNVLSLHARCPRPPPRGPRRSTRSTTSATSTARSS